MPHNRKAIAPKVNSGITGDGNGNTNGSSIYANKKISRAPPVKMAPSSNNIRSPPFNNSSEKIVFSAVFLNILNTDFIINPKIKLILVYTVVIITGCVSDYFFIVFFLTFF